MSNNTVYVTVDINGNPSGVFTTLEAVRTAVVADMYRFMDDPPDSADALVVEVENGQDVTTFTIYRPGDPERTPVDSTDAWHFQLDGQLDGTRYPTDRSGNGGS